MANVELTTNSPSSSVGLNDMGKASSKKTEAPWLKCIKDFNALVPNLPQELTTNSDDAHKVVKQTLRNVTVALIDDGVDILSPEMACFQNRFMLGRSFDTSSDGPAPSISSLTGHGTFMARLILHVCPYAKIIPYRLMMTVDPDGNVPRPEPGSAVKVRATISLFALKRVAAIDKRSCDSGNQRSN